MTTPYDVGRWLAQHVDRDDHSSGDKRVSEGELLIWAGRAAQPIDRLEIDNSGDGAFVVHYKDVGQLVIKDSGRSCCESRYMSCDDDLTSFHGARIVGIDLEAVAPAGYVEPEQSEWGNIHDVMFLKVRTTNGDLTLVSHNEHNGYYGGISPVIVWQDIH